jgi:hypothetical protein
MNDLGGANDLWRSRNHLQQSQTLLKQQETFISFTIAPDGHLLAMRLEMKDSNLKLRARFAVN